MEQTPLVVDEQDLIQRATAGELEAFNRLVLHYQGLAYSVAYRTVQDGDAAADAVQDSFLKAFRSLNSFHGGSFKSWLVRIVINTCYDILRAQRRRASESLDDLPVEHEYIPQLTDPDERPEEYAERMELSAAIEAGFAELPVEQRVVLALCDVHGYAYDEIALLLNLPMGTVKSRISRARARLRDFLLDQPELLPASFRPRDG